MEPLQADLEDIREIKRASDIIYKCMIHNDLVVAYVMEALQLIYAHQASQLASYERYCEAMNYHKEEYKKLWDNR